MASPRDPGARVVHARTALDWRAWLVEHHDEPGVWLLRPRKGPGAPTYDDLIVEALAFGWIDGQSAPWDDEHSALWMTRRRAGSGWSRLSKARWVRVEAEGLAQPEGRAAVERAHTDGSWTLLDSVEDLVVPDDLAAALAEEPGAREAFDGFTASVRKLNLRWLVEARRPATRAARVAEVARCAGDGEPARHT
jgi:uncharacterized protein YdeI (YjbR/CyaY-like superfamily)